MTEITDIIDNGESEVQIATIGKVIGSTTDGKPVEQNFSEDALKHIAESQMDEILVDADHESELGGKTDAKGWLSNLKFVKGKGLFGTIKWTDIGRKLIENRVFRWLSPSWKVNAMTKEPMLMTSCALTNKPSQAGRIEPIINAEPQETETTENVENVENNEETETNENFEIEKDITDMTKDEIMALIDERVAAILNERCNKEEEEEETTVNSAPNVEETNEVVEEVKTEEVKTEEVVEEVNNETNEDEVKEETKEDVVEEVIKLETLNSEPVVEVVDAWKNLHGKAFWDYLSKQK